MSESAKAANDSGKLKKGNSKRETERLLLDAVDRTAKAQGVWMRRVTLASGALACLAVFFMGWHTTRPPIPPQTYAAERDTGRIMRLEPLEYIAENPGSVSNAAARFTTAIFSMNAFNYEQRFAQNVRPLFYSQAAYSDFQTGVANSSWFAEMLESQMQMRASVTGVPVITDQGYITGTQVRYWDVNYPVYIRLEAAGVNPINIRRVMTMRIAHSNEREHADGFAIASVTLDRS